MQCSAEGVATDALLNGMQPEQYAAMLTAENAREVLGLLDVGSNTTLLDAKAVMAGAVDTLLQAENKLHSSVTATAAAATVHVRICSQRSFACTISSSLKHQSQRLMH